MEAEQAERRLVAILSADAVGYSRLMADDEVATMRTIGEYRRVLADLVAEHRGRVVDAPGDNLLAEFPSASEAVRSAVAMQRALAERNAVLPDGRRMRFRIGVHLGEVLTEDGRLYGDGVNVAARLEGMADPGGICVSGEVHGQVARRLELRFQDLGERPVKNLPDPVRVYKASVAGGGPAALTPGRRFRGLALVSAVVVFFGVVLALSWPRPLGILIDLTGLNRPLVDPALPDRPSLVVLPFSNLSEDPAQEYFADGITEDLTTDLAGVWGLFVIARNSAFAYKREPVDVERIGRELGVRYVLEGSVRRVDDSVRINAQLIDAASCFHVWSERYDRAVSDIFALQSEISQQILAALEVEIREAEMRRILRKRTEDLSA